MSTAIVSSKDQELEEMIRHLQTRMVYLEGRVAQLESGRNPYNPAWPATNPQDCINNRCPKCGITFSGVVGYVCASINCPKFLNVSCEVK